MTSQRVDPPGAASRRRTRALFVPGVVLVAVAAAVTAGCNGEPEREPSSVLTVTSADDRPLVSVDFADLIVDPRPAWLAAPATTAEYTPSVAAAPAALSFARMPANPGRDTPVPDLNGIRIWTFDPADRPVDVSAAMPGELIAWNLQNVIADLPVQTLDGAPTVAFSCQRNGLGGETDSFVMGALIGTADGVVWIGAGEFSTPDGQPMGTPPVRLAHLLDSVTLLTDPAPTDPTTWLNRDSPIEIPGSTPYPCTTLDLDTIRTIATTNPTPTSNPGLTDAP